MAFEKKRKKSDKTNNKAYRACRHASTQLHYDVFEEKCNPAILYPVYDAIERTRADKRPPRAALLIDATGLKINLYYYYFGVATARSLLLRLKETITTLKSSLV
jgi:hypothetical protein